jgi:DNA-binding transcriptional regulator PaaX
MNKKNKKPNIQKAILKVLSEKPAISVPELNKKNLMEGRKNSYALNRSIKQLVESGCVEIKSSDNQKYLKITKKGQSKLNSIRLEGEEALVPNTWDGFWRIIILDIPEERKSEREALRYLLKKANFICVKNTVWISPHPYEHLFTNIKKDLNLKNELMIIVTNKLDPETNLEFLKALKK